MKTKTESVVVITNSRDQVVGMVHKDPQTHKNLIYVVSDAKMDQIADIIAGKFEEPPIPASGEVKP